MKARSRVVACWVGSVYGSTQREGLTYDDRVLADRHDGRNLSLEVW